MSYLDLVEAASTACCADSVAASVAASAQNHLAVFGPAASDSAPFFVSALAPLTTLISLMWISPSHAKGLSFLAKQAPSVLHVESWSAKVELRSW